MEQVRIVNRHAIEFQAFQLVEPVKVRQAVSGKSLSPKGKLTEFSQATYVRQTTLTDPGTDAHDSEHFDAPTPADLGHQRIVGPSFECNGFDFLKEARSQVSAEPAGPSGGR